MHRAFHSFFTSFRALIQGIDEEDKSLPAVWEGKQIYKRLEYIAEVCESFLDWDQQEDYVFWMEKRRLSFAQNKNELFSKEDGQSYPIIHKTPLSIAKTMNTGVFSQFETVICTSATLQTSSGFLFGFREMVDNIFQKSDLFVPPFRQILIIEKMRSWLYLPICRFLIHLFFKQVWKNVLKLLQASEGRALVLFTSFESLRSTASYLRDNSHLLTYPLLVQGEADRFNLLKQFKEKKDSILLATTSFWEGVDVPGDSLSHVIIVKLPFAVPNEPVFAARSEAIEKQGRSSFAELSLPGAIIAFRQGFGRLMRRNTDRGIITVLDRRLLAKSYGRLFLTSLPETRQLFCPMEDLVFEIKSFLK